MKKTTDTPGPTPNSESWYIDDDGKRKYYPGRPVLLYTYSILERRTKHSEALP